MILYDIILLGLAEIGYAGLGSAKTDSPSLVKNTFYGLWKRLTICKSISLMSYMWLIRSLANPHVLHLLRVIAVAL